MPRISCIRLAGIFCVAASLTVLPTSSAQSEQKDGGDGHYTEEQVYASRPRVDRERHFGHIGVTGIDTRIYKGMKLTVESSASGSPTDGKFKKGDVLLGINDTALEGRNPFVTLGKALTEAEATDGRMVFDVAPVDGTGAKKVEVRIPVLGRYSRTWPLNCEKSRTIIQRAADYYSDKDVFGKNYLNERGVRAALVCLFLLSTGDDRYLPRVRDYLSWFIEHSDSIGDHTWNNGYNGILCAEYYLRTGDAAIMPVIQFYCDNARDRQYLGGWNHWDRTINPEYMDGALMNAAGVQVLTSLLLAKECGADVDEATLLRALKLFYRFVGHGTVAYGDHRAEGGLGSNGKDAMLAMAMQVASGAQGDVSFYRQAVRHLSMATITSYPKLVRGHGDEGRGDAIWRGMASSLLIEDDPDAYHESMDRLTWWFDLSRRANGGIGVATIASPHFDDVGSGAGLALAYTAPLRNLRITGAPRSKYARSFTLPEHLWGTRADRAFLDHTNNPAYHRYGGAEPTHTPFWAFGSAYSEAATSSGGASRDEMVKNLYHRRYMIRAQAAKALRKAGALGELETRLTDSDPRVRRAALDGLIDFRYYWGMGKDPIKPAQYTPGMITAIVGMLKDPDEAWYVVDGALFAMRNMPAEVIQKNTDAILPWTTHEEWWLRHSSFMALSGLEKDDDLYLDVLPTLFRLMTAERHVFPRQVAMRPLLLQVMKKKGRDSAIGSHIIAAMIESARTTRIGTDWRSEIDGFNVHSTVRWLLKDAPESAPPSLEALVPQLGQLSTHRMSRMINDDDSLCKLVDTQRPEERRRMVDILYDNFRTELLKRAKTFDRDGGDAYLELLNAVSRLSEMKRPGSGWKAIGTPALSERVWRYTTFDPQNEKDRRQDLREVKKVFRRVTLPAELEGWETPDYDDSAWRSGKAPMGKGTFGGGTFKNNSDWGNGEFIVMRSEFELEPLDFDSYRLSVLSNQGFDIYLNGHLVHTYIWYKNKPYYRPIPLDENVRHLRKGVNVLAVYSNTEPHPELGEIAQIDVRVEGVRMSDLQAGNEARD